MKNCAFCQKPFEAKSKRLCCDRSCSAKLSMQRKGKAAWSQEEIEFLIQNLGSHPFPKLVRMFERWAKKNGYQKRTATAIGVKIHRLTIRSPLSRKCTEDNFTVYELARSLGVKMEKVRRFVRKGKLKPEKVAKNQSAISRKTAIDLVLNNPQYFAECDRDNLFWLLEDDRLVAQVKSATPSTRGFSKPVRCYSPEGVKVYSGVKEAARANYVTHSSIGKAIARKGKSAGMVWEYCQG